MTDLDLLHFEQLKKDVQAQYLKEYTPSYDEISKWKGIDIIYFQEDLRKKAKGNISEKSFYTYFKSSPVTKLPRIDMLNLLSIYAGYDSWYEFKKTHLFAGELLKDEDKITDEEASQLQNIVSEVNIADSDEIKPQNSVSDAPKLNDLQKNNTENQYINKNSDNSEIAQKTLIKNPKKNYQKTAWITATAIFVTLLGLLGFKDEIFQKTYVYCFTDADRNLSVQRDIEIKVIKENESPILYRIKPGECFRYPTKDKTLKMQISSTTYENLEINRNLENAPEEETIELKPDDYKMALYYFSIKDINGENSEQLIKQKRKQLESLISNNAVITQVYDSDIYGLETLDKEDYITLVTTPTTSLKNLNVIEMIKAKGKIVSIKFKISSHENNK
ncbi:hypothetical protein IX39_15020 [Chryseobacterium formosense]|uniref:Uncharacterized protein n=1 Tax=Chryseobacterium formosense TaxID=236814 RepID=A0A085Z2R3_9FLAO|nr:hypothetical protein [Chryseobacterium formosense]KFE98726.1 hypothetical protein IX39_15020 [Chryseobacterium formosense]SFT56791.1 hypothetical protein SAMN05421857_1698 [Chryseobacterium formosense]